ncbi:hypothetical protein [Vibrio parahaemolyticus]|uniref:hypothetical protein n=1 Tax=Vibrio parahaemolyticus TaxID=670 RepID=UPI0012B8BB05|nr:hypothetical protein [Vibrio parahaemolyticus]
MKSKKFSNGQLATVFMSSLGFSLLSLHYLWQHIFATERANSNPFLDDAFIKATPYFIALMIALSVTNVVSKIRNSEKS